MLRFAVIAAALLGAVTGPSGPAAASQEASDAGVLRATEIEGAPIAAADAAPVIEHIEATVEGEPVALRVRRYADDRIEFDARPIFEHLNGEVSLDRTVLALRRFQDGARLTLDVSDGKVRANGVVLGALPDFTPKAAADTWLSANAVSVLSGTIADVDASGRWTFTLDDRLRAKFDLDLWVQGERVDTSAAEPRTVGSVLLVPLLPVVEALGHTISQEGDVVTVVRVQDAATISLDVSTGLVTVNERPEGISPNLAFADPVALLLPFSAIETLTGTHITLAPGASRIDVELDQRLSGGVLPGERVADEAAETGFVPESLAFNIGSRGPSTFEFNSRLRRFNTQARYETVGPPQEPSELTPGFVALDVQSLDGWVATLGDYNSQFRELSGVDENRIRGVAWRKRRESGTILAIAAGIPFNGAVQVSEGGSRPTFGGFAGGGRLIFADGRNEVGFSVSRSEGLGEGRAVLSGQKRFNVSDTNEPGLKRVAIQGDIGVFDDEDGLAVDARGRLEASYNVTRQVGFRARLSYDGARFLSSIAPADSGAVESEEILVLDPIGEPAPAVDTVASPDFEGALDDGLGARVIGTASTDWRAVRDWGAFRNVAANLRTTVTHETGPGDTTVSLTGSANTRLAPLDVDLSFDAGFTQSETGGETTRANSVALRAQRRFRWGAAQASYTRTAADNGAGDQRLVGNVNILPLRKGFGRGASVAVGPSLSAGWAPGSGFASGGATIIADSGSAFGDRLTVRGQASALQSVDPENTQTSFFANLAADLRLTRNIGLTATYFDNFNGQRDVTAALRGRVSFNAPRRHTQPREGLGVLTGQAFFDRNRDGVRQPGEPGIGGVRISIVGTRLALNADRDGNFTITNMRKGLYDLGVDLRSLPLGFQVAEESQTRFTVGDGRITRLDVPLIASGQIRGAVFVDANRNGALDAGERRLEGARLTLEGPGEDDELAGQAAAFGQYGFENLGPGDYKVRARAEGRTAEVAVTLTDDALFVVAPIPFEPTEAERTAPPADEADGFGALDQVADAAGPAQRL